MKFKDEYETEHAGQTFYVEVEGEQFVEDSFIHTEIGEVHIVSELGEAIDEDHHLYLDLVKEAKEREYEPEVHSRDFDYYEEAGA